jgi:acylphosphatase
MHSVHGFVSGRVQGVGFRYFVRGEALRQGLRGYVINLADGRVEFLLQGEAGAVDQVLESIRRGPRHARVDSVSVEPACDLPAREGFSTR